MRINQKLKPVVVLLISAGFILLFLPLSVWSANLLQNDGLEPPFNKYGTWTGGGITFDLEVAHNWEKFYVPGGTPDNGNKLRYFRSSATEFLFGSVEKRDGADAQIFWSTSPFDAGIYQQVSGLTIGETYGFQAGILQVYGKTTNGINNKMFRSVGIDPYGGTDPTSSNVAWGPEEGRNGNWFYPGVGMQAMSSTATVFVKVRSIDDAPLLEESVVWVDDTFMDVAPTTTLALTVDSPTQVTAAWSGTPRSGFHLFAYEAQYRKTSESTWIDLQIFTSNNSPSTNVSQSFTVEPGSQYIVRARTWHEQDGGDSHEMPGSWVTDTLTIGGIVSGKVFDNQGNSVGGATISISSSPATNTTSIGGGSYNLLTGAGTFMLAATNVSGWTTSQPISVTVPNLAAVVPLTITLRPPDDVANNGDFEDGLNGWLFSGTAPATNTSKVYNGSSSLKLSGNVTISQTGFISGSYQPTLSFWYKVADGDDNDTLTAEILGSTGLTATNSFNTSTIGDWQYMWLPLNLTEVYTGPVGVRFNLSQSGGTQTVVYLDQVSLGSSQELSYIYLPIVFKLN